MEDEIAFHRLKTQGAYQEQRALLFIFSCIPYTILVTVYALPSVL